MTRSVYTRGLVPKTSPCKKSPVSCSHEGMVQGLIGRLCPGNKSLECTHEGTCWYLLQGHDLVFDWFIFLFVRWD